MTTDLVPCHSRRYSKWSFSRGLATKVFLFQKSNLGDWGQVRCHDIVILIFSCNSYQVKIKHQVWLSSLYWIWRNKRSGPKPMGSCGRAPSRRSFVGNFISCQILWDMNAYFWRILRRNDAQSMDLLSLRNKFRQELLNSRHIFD